MAEPLTPRASMRGISIQGLDDSVASVDVLFDEHRVWSIDVRSATDSQLPWPEALRPYLIGSSRVSIVNSANGEVISVTDVRFSVTPRRVEIKNDDGIWLSLNKWMRLAPSLTEIGGEIHERILDRSEEIIAQLTTMG